MGNAHSSAVYVVTHGSDKRYADSPDFLRAASTAFIAASSSTAFTAGHRLDRWNRVVVDAEQPMELEGSLSGMYTRV